MFFGGEEETWKLDLDKFLFHIHHTLSLYLDSCQGALLSGFLNFGSTSAFIFKINLHFLLGFSHFLCSFNFRLFINSFFFFFLKVVTTSRIFSFLAFFYTFSVSFSLRFLEKKTLSPFLGPYNFSQSITFLGFIVDFIFFRVAWYVKSFIIYAFWRA